MKILLIQSYLGKGVLRVYPLGLACLASGLADNDTHILDLNSHPPLHRLDPFLKAAHRSSWRRHPRV